MSNGVPLVPAPRVPPQTPPPRPPRGPRVRIQIGVPVSVPNPFVAAILSRIFRAPGGREGTPGIAGELPPDLPFQPTQPEPTPTIPRVRVRPPPIIDLPPGPRFGFALPSLIGIVLTEFGSSVLDRLLKRESDRMQAEADAEIEIYRRRQQARARERDVLTLPPMPQLPESPADRERDVMPDVVARPHVIPSTRVDTRPGPRTAEPLEIPFEIPFPTVRPIFSPVPSPLPLPTPAPTTRPGTRPSLRPLVLPLMPPVPIPLGVPSPLQIPLPAPLPLPTPIPTPRPIALPTPVDLTGFQESPLSFAEPGTAPRVQDDPQSAEKRCESQCEKKRRRNRQTCWKGLYRESTSDTRFTKWQRIDCRTGREL